MYKIVRIPIASIFPDSSQPRKFFDSGKLVLLSESMKRQGQILPVIVYEVDGKWILADGEMRWRAGQLGNISDLLAIPLPERPSLRQLRSMQCTLEVQRTSLTIMERSDLLAQIKAETGAGPTELAADLSMNQSVVSKYLKLQDGAPEVKAMLHTGALDLERGYAICRFEDKGKQLEMLKGSAHLSREAIRAKVKNGDKPQPKAKRSVFLLPSGMSVTINGRDADLQMVIEGLQDVLKELKRGLSQGLDILTAQKVLKNKAGEACGVKS